MCLSLISCIENRIESYISQIYYFLDKPKNPNNFRDKNSHIDQNGFFTCKFTEEIDTVTEDFDTSCLI